MPLDYFGQELDVGDTVIWGTVTGEARGFNCGTVVKFNPKKIVVADALKKHWRGTWVKDKTYAGGGYWDSNLPQLYQCYPEQLCKVAPELLTIKLLMK